MLVFCGAWGRKCRGKNVSLYIPQGTLSPSSHEKEKISILMGKILSKITPKWIIPERLSEYGNHLSGAGHLLYLKPNNLLFQALSKHQLISPTFPFIQKQLESNRRQWRWWFVVSQSSFALITGVFMLKGINNEWGITVRFYCSSVAR